LNEYRKMFKDARRLQPSEELWRRIAAESALSTAMKKDSLRAITPLRAAAILALAAGLAGLWFQQARRQDAGGTASAGSGLAAASEMIDPDLLAWQSRLGDFDWKSDRGFPFTDTASGDDWLGASVLNNSEEGDWL
jgi:hypothetical protein